MKSSIFYIAFKRNTASLSRNIRLRLRNFFNPYFAYSLLASRWPRFIRVIFVAILRKHLTNLSYRSMTDGNHQPMTYGLRWIYAKTPEKGKTPMYGVLLIVFKRNRVVKTSIFIFFAVRRFSNLSFALPGSGVIQTLFEFTMVQSLLYFISENQKIRKVIPTNVARRRERVNPSFLLLFI